MTKMNPFAKKELMYGTLQYGHTTDGKESYYNFLIFNSEWSRQDYMDTVTRPDEVMNIQIEDSICHNNNRVETLYSAIGE